MVFHIITWNISGTSELLLLSLDDVSRLNEHVTIVGDVVIIGDFHHGLAHLVDHGLGESQLFLQPISVGDQLFQISWIGCQTAEVIGQEMIGLDLVHVFLLHRHRSIAEEGVLVSASWGIDLWLMD